MVEPCHPFHRQAGNARPRDAPSGDQFVRNRTEREDVGRPAPGTPVHPLRRGVRPAHRGAQTRTLQRLGDSEVDDPALPVR